MPKKKKATKKKSGTRRRRVGGVGGNNVMTTGIGVIAGAVGGPILMGMVTKMVPSVSPTIVKWGAVAVQAGAGYYLVKKQKSPFMQGLGYGLVGAGGLTAVRALVPSLISGVPVLMPAQQRIGMGPQSVPRVGFVNASGFNQPATVSGTPNKRRMSRATTIMGGIT